MRYSIALAGLLATSTIAKPLQHQKHHQNVKKAVVYATAYETVFSYVYVTEDAAAVASTSSTSTAATTTSTRVQVWANQGNRHHYSSKKSSTSTTAAEPSSTSTTEEAASTTVVPVSTTPVPTVASTTPEATVASTTSAAAAATSSVATSYQDIVLLHHNTHRANHSAPDLSWSASLAQIAFDEASVCVYAHNTTGGGGGYGQNIAAGVPPANVSAIITTMMYNGEMTWYAGMYGDTNPSFTNFEHWGHFSQIVWKETTEVGCATVECTGGLGGVSSAVSPYFTVCNYSPAGNMGGEYGDNIGSPLGQDSIQWNYGLSE